MTILKRNGADLSYTTTGEGPVLILIPGANGTGNIFTQAAAYFKEHFTVVTYDRRGFGDSKLTQALPDEAADIHSTYRLKTDADDVAALATTLSQTSPFPLWGPAQGRSSRWKRCRTIRKL